MQADPSQDDPHAMDDDQLVDQAELQDPMQVDSQPEDASSEAGPSIQAGLQAELSELKDKYLRLMAEFDNFRKRTARERMQERLTAAENTIKAILPVVDDFDRAKATAEKPDSEETFSVGVDLVYNKLKRTIDGLGAKQMESNGQIFDPELHEAFTEIPAPTPELAGRVVDTIEPGYFLNDKLIRHAKVVIGK